MASINGDPIDRTDESSLVSSSEVTSSRSWFSWCPTSERLLEITESRILSHLKTHYEKKFVRTDQGHRIWTLKLNPASADGVPMVMVHGFGGGVGLWALNLDHLSKTRSVYAFDLLGFGRSSRPQFSHDAEAAEKEFVESIESWRKELGLEKFILLGHSLGGYLSSSYAMKYPERVKHLILVDPWGFPEKPPDDELRGYIPGWVKVLGAILSPFNPLASLRAAGPFGPSLVQRFRPDFQRKYSRLFEDDTVLKYIYHCNAQTPSGETAFKHMSIPYGWAKFPMINRIGNLDRRVPITFVHGSRSWMDNDSSYTVKYERKDINYVDVQVVKGAGHHVYADKPDSFNDIVDKVYDMVDTSVHDDEVVLLETNV